MFILRMGRCWLSGLMMSILRIDICCMYVVNGIYGRITGIANARAILKFYVCVYKH